MNFPADFISFVHTQFKGEAASFLAALSDAASVSFRLNPLKSSRNPLTPAIPLQKVPWSQWGFYLEERPSFTFDPLFHTGYYYVQEASSMFVEYVVRKLIDKPSVCLDLCAAPGGKSVSLLSALPEGSLLVSNEVMRQRAHVLSETIIKTGYSDGVVTNNNASDFAQFPSLFDLVLIDAPCSGEGMFRKDETAVAEWSLRNVEMCAARQREIVRDVWPSLKPGGLLIYSTCTFNTLENEENALWITEELGASFLAVNTEAEWGITTMENQGGTGCRFLPHKTRGEGLFVTVLQKLDEGESGSDKRGARRKQKQSPFLKDRVNYSDRLLHADRFDFLASDNHIFALPAEHSSTILSLRERLKIISMGVEMGELKGKSFIPSHALAMSANLHLNAFPQYEVDTDTAIRYLRHEAIVLHDAPLGYLLLTYLTEPLGFVKNLGNRANNLYPNEWRIRSGYVPEKKNEIFIL